MSKQIGVSVPDSETLSSEKSKRFTVSEFVLYTDVEVEAKCCF